LFRHRYHVFPDNSDVLLQVLPSGIAEAVNFTADSNSDKGLPFFPFRKR
jgi:hypothetical protein